MQDDGQNIYLEVPISEEYAHLLRLMVSGIASRMNFNLDAVDDLKIAVEEAFLLAINNSPKENQGISFRCSESKIEITLEGLIQSRENIDENQRKGQDYGLFIVEAVVDELEIVEGKDGSDLKLVKLLK